MRSLENKKAKFDYEIIETLEAGIVLTGAETKSVKKSGASMTGARIIEREGGMYVMGMNIPKYEFSNDGEYDPIRVRKLLLRRKEILAIRAKREGSGLTLIPVRLYNKGAFVKVQIGLVRGKKQYEKRETIKKRTEDRWLARQTKKLK